MAKDYFEAASRQFPAVTWYKDPALRKTYIVRMFVVLTLAMNGYDGSMMNGLQILLYWESYLNNPHGSLLGLLNCVMAVGSLCAIPVIGYILDILSRRLGIVIGYVCLDAHIRQSH
jgi:MFS family permease